MRRSFWQFFALVCAVASLGSGPVLAKNADMQNLVIWALEQDSGSWAWNRLDRGSYGPVVEQTGYAQGERVYRMNYTFNGGSAGWVEVFIKDGNAAGIRYHDKLAWAAIRTEQQRRSASDDSKEACRRRAQADGLDTFSQCGW